MTAVAVAVEILIAHFEIEDPYEEDPGLRGSVRNSCSKEPSDVHDRRGSRALPSWRSRESLLPYRANNSKGNTVSYRCLPCRDGGWHGAPANTCEHPLSSVEVKVVVYDDPRHATIDRHDRALKTVCRTFFSQTCVYKACFLDDGPPGSLNVVLRCSGPFLGSFHNRFALFLIEQVLTKPVLKKKVVYHFFFSTREKGKVRYERLFGSI